VGMWAEVTKRSALVPSLHALVRAWERSRCHRRWLNQDETIFPALWGSMGRPRKGINPDPEFDFVALRTVRLYGCLLQCEIAVECRKVCAG